MGLQSGVTQAAGNWALDALSLVPSSCHVSDLALGLNQQAGDILCGGQDCPRSEVIADCCPPAPKLCGYLTVQAAPDPLEVTAQPFEAKQGVCVFPGNAAL